MTESPYSDPRGDVPPVPPPPPRYGAAPQYGAAPAAPLSDSDQRLWATLSHLGGIFFSFIAPLVIWLVFKDRGRYVEDQAKEALNFQIAVAIAYVVSSALTVIGIGVLMLAVVWVAAIVFEIIAGMAANRGEPYRYPVTLRLVT